MKHAVITGATGFIGVNLIQQLSARGWTVTAVVRPHSKNLSRIPSLPGVRIIESYLTDYGNLADKAGGRADAFFHLAWEGGRKPGRDDEALQEKNYEGAMEAARQAVRLGVSFFLVSGSQAEYGHFSGLVDEQHPLRPVSQYGRYKLKTLEAVRKMLDGQNVRFFWTRIFSAYGKYDYPGTLLMTALQKMKRNERLDMTEGTQMWDYLAVEDVAGAMIALLNSGADGGVYNIASGDRRPLREYMTDMKRILHSDSELNFGAVPYGSEGVISFEVDITKLTEDTGWKPQVSFEKGIRLLAESV